MRTAAIAPGARGGAGSLRRVEEGERGQLSQMADPAVSRAARLWAAAESRGIPLRTILVTVAVAAAVYLAGKLLYRLREVVLLILVAGFVAMFLNPMVVALQRWRIRRRGWAVAVVTL